MPKRLTPIGSGSSVRILWLEARQRHQHPGGGIIWAGCNKPTPPIQMTITNPGTSFARMVAATPTYKASSVNFSFPCPPKPWDPKPQHFSGRPKPLEVDWKKNIPGYVMNKKNAMSNE
jgi:hypothetical protein